MYLFLVNKVNATFQLTVDRSALFSSENNTTYSIICTFCFFFATLFLPRQKT